MNQIFNKIISLFIFIIISTFESKGQMNKMDSALNINLWNSINWNLEIKYEGENYKYSNGRNHIEYISNEKGMPIEAKTFYFDSTLAMFSKLFTSDYEASIQPNKYYYESLKFYPNGSLREIEIELKNIALKYYYNENGDVFHEKKIIGNDTISGIFIGLYDSDFNFQYRIFKNKKYQGTIVVSPQNVYVKCFGGISNRNAKKEFKILKNIISHPYKGW
jgi:hypothetical protein